MYTKDILKHKKRNEMPILDNKVRWLETRFLLVDYITVIQENQECDNYI